MSNTNVILMQPIPTIRFDRAHLLYTVDRGTSLSVNIKAYRQPFGASLRLKLSLVGCRILLKMLGGIKKTKTQNNYEIISTDK